MNIDKIDYSPAQYIWESLKLHFIATKTITFVITSLKYNLFVVHKYLWLRLFFEYMLYIYYSVVSKCPHSVWAGALLSLFSLDQGLFWAEWWISEINLCLTVWMKWKNASYCWTNVIRRLVPLDETKIRPIKLAFNTVRSKTFSKTIWQVELVESLAVLSSTLNWCLWLVLWWPAFLIGWLLT